MEEGEALLDPLTLGQERGLSCGRSSAESAEHSLVCLVLMEGVTKLKFAILCSGATIYDGGKSERSNVCTMCLVKQITTTSTVHDYKINKRR